MEEGSYVDLVAENLKKRGGRLQRLSAVEALEEQIEGMSDEQKVIRPIRIGCGVLN